MNEVVKIFLSMSLSGSIMIVLLSIFCVLFGKKLSRRWQYYIWLVAIIRLLLPVAPQQNLMNRLFQESGVAVSTSGIPENTAAQYVRGDDRMETGNDWEDVTFQVTASEMRSLYTGEAEGWNIKQYLWIFLLLPAMLLLTRKITAYQGFIRCIRAGSEEVQDIARLEQFGRLAEEARVKGHVVLLVNRRIPSPMLLGFFHPCVVLPSADLPDMDFAYTVMHELVHCKRRDMVYKWLVQITVCLHWFNPLVYLLRKNTDRFCELSCDEAVIAGLGQVERFAYGDTLLRAARRGGTYKNTVLSLALSDNKKRMKERLDAIMGFKRATKGTIILSVLFTMLFLTCASYTGVYAVGKQNSAASGEKADANTAVAVKVRGRDTGSLETDSKDKKDASWGITKKDGMYYYRNGSDVIRASQRFRSFVDPGEKYSSYNKEGTVDLRVIRGKDNSISKIEILSNETENIYLAKNKI